MHTYVSKFLVKELCGSWEVGAGAKLNIVELIVIAELVLNAPTIPFSQRYFPMN